MSHPTPFDAMVAEATKRIHGLIAQEAGSIGPHELDDDDEPIHDRPLAGAELDEWVLVMAWRHPPSGDTIVTRTISANLAGYRENGLLHEALYDFD